MASHLVSLMVLFCASMSALETIESVVKEADLKEEYESRVVEMDGGLRETILRAVSDYGTICIGATRSTTVEQALFGSIQESIAEETDANVAIARGEVFKQRTVTEGLIEWLSS